MPEPFVTGTLPLLPSAREARTFLAGPTLYLRGIELGDAEHAPAWSPLPFPLPRELVEARMREEAPRAAARRTHRLIACRHGDDRQLGCLDYAADDGMIVSLAVHAGPLPADAGQAAMTEMLSVAVPWLLHERDAMVIRVEIPVCHESVVAGLRALGMRAVARYRQGHFARGRFHDLLCFEALHPVWETRLGRPEIAAEGAEARELRQLVRALAVEDAPANAFVVGPRLYLRPLEPGDTAALARGYAEETESAHDQGRELISPVTLWEWNKAHAAETPPATIRFAIVARADETAIGSNGLVAIDWVHRSAVTETEIVRQEYRGAGYGSEAKHLLLDYAFQRLGINSVRSYSWAYNTRSCRALLKQGYRVAGGLSWTGVKNAEFVNDVVFDLLADEWRAALGE